MQKWQKTDKNDRKPWKMWSFANYLLPSSHFCPAKFPLLSCQAAISVLPSFHFCPAKLGPPGRKSLIIQVLRHLYQYSTKYVAHIPSQQCTFLKGYLVQTYSRFVYIYPSSAGVSILKDIGCIHTRNMHQYTLLWECIHMKYVWYKLTRNMHTHILIVYFIEL